MVLVRDLQAGGPCAVCGGPHHAAGLGNQHPVEFGSGSVWAQYQLRYTGPDRLESVLVIDSDCAPDMALIRRELIKRLELELQKAAIEPVRRLEPGREFETNEMRIDWLVSVVSAEVGPGSSGVGCGPLNESQATMQPLGRLLRHAIRDLRSGR